MPGYHDGLAKMAIPLSLESQLSLGDNVALYGKEASNPGGIKVLIN